LASDRHEHPPRRNRPFHARGLGHGHIVSNCPTPSCSVRKMTFRHSQSAQYTTLLRRSIVLDRRCWLWLSPVLLSPRLAAAAS
jgi:hypothetical protein